MDITPENVAHRVGVTRHQAAEGYGCNCLWKVQGQDHSNYREDTDGKIKAWLYDTIGSRVDYTAPGNSSTRMAYRADGTRLFSCRTNKDGDYYIVEWNESEGVVKHTYEGLKRSVEVVQFDTAKNCFLAAGDELWDMDNIGLLKVFDVGGGLPASP
nr:topless-related protein 4-like isoform X1 [Tanacetum cinerariifolium]